MQLYQKLCKALDDNTIDELGILPFTPNLEDLPLDSQPYHPLVLIETKLGIAKAEISTLLKQMHHRFITLDARKNPVELEEITRAMILLKPDNYTAMNARKTLMQSAHIDPKDELNLIKLAFTIPRHSKSSTAWYHRQWILNHYETAIQIEEEIDLCRTACAAYARNYYAWTHRTFLLLKYRSLIDLTREYSDICHWIELHISDYSGLHYLQHIIEFLLFSQDQAKQEQHMQWLDELIIKYPGYESLWSHRRFCSHLFVESKVFCHNQHQFVCRILSDQHKAEALNDHADGFELQKQYALKFGLWQTMMEKRCYGQPMFQSYVDNYTSVAPTPDFLEKIK